MSNRRQITVLNKCLIAALLNAVLALAIGPAPMVSAGIGTVNAHVVRLRNNQGQVICTLFTPSDRFPDQSHKGMTIAVPIKNRQATCQFRNLPYGNYAIVAFHDENHDGEFNQNWLGLPMEGFGFSNNPGTLKKPTFNDAKFIASQPIVQVTIELNYWF
ncbi:MAG: DUF2141 domain-containing protein [Deltaproteobacteria bacterium]|nr:DUF2141 domain-containing protein [Deltaproteobacteria bacterium]